MLSIFHSRSLNIEGQKGPPVIDSVQFDFTTILNTDYNGQHKGVFQRDNYSIFNLFQTLLPITVHSAHC